METMESNWHL